MQELMIDKDGVDVDMSSSRKGVTGMLSDLSPSFPEKESKPQQQHRPAALTDQEIP